MREFYIYRKKEVNDVYVYNYRSYQAEVKATMDAIRQEKEYRIRNDYERNIRDKETVLIQQKGELADALTRIQRTLQDINELHVCKAELEDSLVVDEKNAVKINLEVEEKIAKLEKYEYTLEKRKAAVAAVGIMEQEVITHINDLLLERGKDLFDGRKMMSMRQFEVLPNVYCQCAIFEDL